MVDRSQSYHNPCERWPNWRRGWWPRGRHYWCWGWSCLYWRRSEWEHMSCNRILLCLETAQSYRYNFISSIIVLLPNLQWKTSTCWPVIVLVIGKKYLTNSQYAGFWSVGLLGWRQRVEVSLVMKTISLRMSEVRISKEKKSFSLVISPSHVDIIHSWF